MLNERESLEHQEYKVIIREKKCKKVEIAGTGLA
jgi:hypothetical protein